MDIQQGLNETLKSYQKWYNDILLTIPEVKDKVAYMVFYRGLTYAKLKKALVLETPLSKDELTTRVRQYVELEGLKNKERKPKDLVIPLGKEGDQNSQGKHQYGENERADCLSRIATTYYNLVGKLPEAQGGAEFTIVAVDYFSKWGEATRLQFLWKNILTRFGIPNILVSDNEPKFEGQVLADYCENFGIERRFAPVYYPQANGQVEVMNRIIFKGIKKNILQSGKGGGSWIEELPTVLWPLRSMPNQATGEAPFSLVYVPEAVLPAKHASKLFTYYV
ncbi:hypothetical protein LIER_33774 [Lithospermum erythrorhizon]|uniref:Integrase catalytic domain-containing protein n=1 Tax=Lithospermum erythrorhizon TaxID=34254 RepID=A0AAV3RXL8_LITER